MKSKQEIKTELTQWAEQARKPTKMLSNHRDLRFPEEFDDAKKLERINAQELTRANVDSLWWSFNYLSLEGLVYFLPSVLSLSLDKEIFPMIDVTPYQEVIWGFDWPTGEPHYLFRQVAACLTRGQKLILKDYFIWQSRYRKEGSIGISEFLSNEQFSSLLN